MAKGMLIAALRSGRAAEDEFHDWFDTEHHPETTEVVESGEGKKARHSDWASRLQPQFRDYLPLVLRRYTRGA